ncbi:MAG: hypothetical protein MRY64_13190 [Hyphomonadaceae bacterium]|nr:hypothetical protein [Hyphomonadaceae bacterium]
MEPWILWPLFGFAMWMIFAKGGACSHRRGRRRDGVSAREASNEVARLKAELEASHAQIEGLKRRLEAVETIVTDEEAQLRRDFDALARS